MCTCLSLSVQVKQTLTEETLSELYTFRELWCSEVCLFGDDEISIVTPERILS
jgi:hypothetical protein